MNCPFQGVIAEKGVQNDTVVNAARKAQTLGAKAHEELRNVFIQPVRHMQVGEFSQRTVVAHHPLAPPKLAHHRIKVPKLDIAHAVQSPKLLPNTDPPRNTQGKATLR